MTTLDTETPPYPAAAAETRPATAFFDTRLARLLTGLFSVALGLVIWEMLSWRFQPLFLPSPRLTFYAVGELWEDGTLLQSIGASLARIMAGWSLGLVIGIPIGMVMGYFSFVRRLLDPYVEFFRFIPPIAFVTLAVIWLGPGEASKVALILYTTIFIVTINTITGVQAVEEDKIRSARSMGASEWQIMGHVIIPASLPYIFTGAKLAMGSSFMAIVGAEMVAANEGIGYMIWNSRLYFKTDWIFVGLLVLGLMGFLMDRVFNQLGKVALKRYNVVKK